MNETKGLTVAHLQKESVRRLAHFKNARGIPAHSDPSGYDWTPAEWLTAVVGELGEAANLIKKLRRGDFTQAQATPIIAEELADTLCYLVLVAHSLGIDLEEATEAKWNKVSRRIAYPVRLASGPTTG